MNLSQLDGMKVWVEGQPQTRCYSNASGYVRHLTGRDHERADTIVAMQTLITEGIDSGISPRSMTNILKAARVNAADPVRDDGLGLR